MQISPWGSVSTFAQIHGPLPGACPGGVGLTTALAVLPGGWVVVGSLPTSDGMSDTAQAGCLIVLNNWGTPVETWSGGNINGPWDLTSVNTWGGAEIFITNVLNGTVADSPKTVYGGTVVRLDIKLNPCHLPALVGSTVIANGSPSALIRPHWWSVPPAWPSGTRDSSLWPTRSTTASPWSRRPCGGGHRWVGRLHPQRRRALNQPLGLALAPNGDVLSANGGDGNIVETTPYGHQIASVQIDPAGMGGDLFGITIAPCGHGVLFVDDGDNTLKLFGPGPFHTH